MSSATAGRSPRTAWRSCCEADDAADELEAQLRDIGARRYHRLHPFHALLHGGKCTKGQVQAWALNRYYYQAMIPVKDASLIARCDDPALRREWRSRLVDHDGEREGDGGIARWLKLTDGLGLDRDYVVSLGGPAAGDAFRGRCLCAFRAREDAARSGRLLADRAVLAADHRRARRGHAEELRFRQRRHARLFLQAPAAGAARLRFRARLRQAPRQDAGAQQAVLAALEFKCDVLWAMLDALYHAYVAPRHVPPGAFVPKDWESARERSEHQPSPPTPGRGCRAACGSSTTRRRAAGCCSRPSGCSRPTRSRSRSSSAAPARRPCGEIVDDLAAPMRRRASASAPT